MNPTLDQANMYSAGLVLMVMGEMANVADEIEQRTNQNTDMEDVRMEEVEREVEELQTRTRDDHDWIIQLQEENGDLRYRNNNLYMR